MKLPRANRGLSLALSAAACLLLAACASSGSFQDGHYRSSAASYRVDAPGESWQRVSFRGNDLAWSAPGAAVIALNSVCEDHGDPSLKVLTDHLLMGFEQREILEREAFTLDGRGALRTRASAHLDGVPVDLELVALKKDGCVYDFIYIAPPSSFAAQQATFRRMVSSFQVSGRP